MFKLIIDNWILCILVIITFIISVFKPKIKGFLGEKGVSVILSRLDSDKYRVINDVIVEVEGKTSQIDHIVVSNYGIFVIETKNYKGWIYGDEHSRYWSQVIYKKKEKLYNPIKQNKGHIRALKYHLQEFEDTFRSIVVFSINSDLRINVTSEVVYTAKLLKTIRKYNKELLTDKEKELIYNKLISLNISSKETRKQHVDSINKMDNIQNESKEVCPKCGGTLITRKGKYGRFRGCNNYPKCKFTSSM